VKDMYYSKSDLYHCLKEVVAFSSALDVVICWTAVISPTLLLVLEGDDNSVGT
jgi:hypothetical protein